MPEWVARGWHEYARRMPSAIDLELIEVSPPRGSGGDARRRESDALLARCRSGELRIAVDERGTAWSTGDLAMRMDGWMMQGDSVALLVGGAAGHSPALRSQSSACWSLGSLTFPHMLVRVILAEQIYRAWTMLSGHPYHRG